MYELLNDYIHDLLHVGCPKSLVTLAKCVITAAVTKLWGQPNNFLQGEINKASEKKRSGYHIKTKAHLNRQGKYLCFCVPLFKHSRNCTIVHIRQYFHLNKRSLTNS